MYNVCGSHCNYKILQVFGHPTPNLAWSLDGKDLPDERRPEREHAEEEEVFFGNICNILNIIVEYIKIPGGYEIFHLSIQN